MRLLVVGGWFSNFYRDGKADYLMAGGNGGVMRIQPHVWCEDQAGLSAASIREIIRNVLCSHGHPRALAGALFHAFQLSLALSERALAAPAEWTEAVNEMATVQDLLRRDEQLSLIWIPTWEQASGRSWNEAWKQALSELHGFVGESVECAKIDAPLEHRYLELVRRLDATSGNVRGEAMRTAVLSQFLAWSAQDRPPLESVLIAANALATDTDTIASVTGALHGAIAGVPPEGELLDRDYIVSEAKRMDLISQGRAVECFSYPNVLTWHAPRTQLEVVCSDENGLRVAGLGRATEKGPPTAGRRKDEVWQILHLDLGQTVVIKRRAQIQPCSKTDQARLGLVGLSKTAVVHEVDPTINQQLSLEESVNTPVKQEIAPLLETMDVLTTRLIANGFPAAAIGEMLLRFAEDPDCLEKAVAFAAIIVKAKRARLKKTF